MVTCVGPSAGGLANEDVSFPLTGSLLERLSGNTCAVVPRIPAFLNPGSRYAVNVMGDRQPDNTPIPAYALVSIRDGEDLTQIDLHQETVNSVLVTSPDEYQFQGALSAA